MNIRYPIYEGVYRILTFCMSTSLSSATNLFNMEFVSPRLTILMSLFFESKSNHFRTLKIISMKFFIHTYK